MTIVQLSMFDGKVCSKCKEWKHCVHFGKNRAKKDGRQEYCYECRSRSKVRLKADPDRPRFRAWHHDHLTDGKVCAGCLKWKPHTAYNKRQRDGKYLCAYCTDCARGRKANYRHEHSGKVNATRRSYYYQNRDHIREKQKALYNTNPDKFRDRGREFYKKFPGKVKDWARRYHKNNPDKVRAFRHLRRARSLAAGGSHTAAEWLALCEWFGNICLACGASGSLTIDHVKPLARGGSNAIDNLQPLCHSCNSSKRARDIDYRDPERLAAFLEYIYATHPTNLQPA